MSGEDKLDLLLSGVRAKIEKLSIYELRQVARAVGVDRPAVGKKSRVTEAIMNIACGTVSPIPQSRRGAPPKSSAVDEELVDEINRCRARALGYGEDMPQTSCVSDSAYGNIENNELMLSGVLSKHGSDYVVVSDEVLGEIFVHQSYVERYSLRSGDYITCRCSRKNNNEKYGLTDVFLVNGELTDGTRGRGEFGALTRIYPQTRIYTGGNGSAACRMCDLFAPLALGQRAIISAPSKSGKTRLLKEIALGICRDYVDIEVVFLLIGEQPEIVTDIKRSVVKARVFDTCFMQSAELSKNTAELAMDYAKRRVECGKDVVVLFDGITRLYRTYRSQGRPAAGVEEIKDILGCACNAEEGGSLTLVSTLSSDAADAALFNEFIGLGNMVLTLSGALAAGRVFPSVDILKSGSDREEVLLTADELRTARALRAELCKTASPEDVAAIFNSTSCNGEIISRYKNG